MLRISEGAISGDSASVRIEGRLVGPWVCEFRRCCEHLMGRGYRLSLDLADLSFLDREGLAALRELLSGHNATLINIPLFIAEQLKDL